MVCGFCAIALILLNGFLVLPRMGPFDGAGSTKRPPRGVEDSGSSQIWSPENGWSISPLTLRFMLLLRRAPSFGKCAGWPPLFGLSKEERLGSPCAGSPTSVECRFVAVEDTLLRCEPQLSLELPDTERPESLASPVAMMSPPYFPTLAVRAWA